MGNINQSNKILIDMPNKETITKQPWNNIPYSTDKKS